MSEFTDISEAELDALIARVNEAIEQDLSLSIADMQLLLNALVMLSQLQGRLADNDITLHKLRKLAGLVKSSEKLAAVSPTSVNTSKRKKSPKTPSKPAASPVIQQRCVHHLEGLEKGQICPLCEQGKLYKYDPAVVLRISGQTPLVNTAHILERLRCNACGEYFTAQASEEVKQDGGVNQRYGYSARAIIAIHKHFGGLPFYRQQSLQQLFGSPVSASSAFDQSEAVANDVQPVVQCLINLSADAHHYYLDDTTNRILNQSAVLKPDRKTGKLKSRKGIFTSGMIATLNEGHECVLFQTNIGHAGEWIDEILKPRSPQVPPPLLMCDALSRNFPSQKTYQLTLCNSHARRQFVDVINQFPDQVPWVLERYGLIWDHDEYCKIHGLSDQQRLDYHQKKSLPVMELLRDWGQEQLQGEVVEENSGLGQAIQYFLRHYDQLTGFCSLIGAQIDNNTMEATLKLVIRGRKNSLFYKTLAGAAIADTLMSLIATCDRAGINAFEYLIVLQRHARDVKLNPEQWLPWRYQETLNIGNLAA